MKTCRILMLAAAPAVFALAPPAEAAPASAEDIAAAAALALGTAALDAVAGSAPIAPVLATIAPPVPEPQTWAMMIIGFGLVGAAIRRRRPALAG